MIRIAIITPTFNRPKLLEKLHASCVLAGSLDIWHHFVVNDGSSSNYSDALNYCESLSGNISVIHVANGGALKARNYALERVQSDFFTHVCFVDDDGVFLPNALNLVAGRLRGNPSRDWFYFPSETSAMNLSEWPPEELLVNWMDDIVLDRTYGSDNFVVLSSRLIGKTRFSEFGRNQREWTFFVDIFRKESQVLVCPDVVVQNTYLEGGLTAQANMKTMGLEQIVNNMHRAWRYFFVRPSSSYVQLNLVIQILMTPVRLLRLVLKKL